MSKILAATFICFSVQIRMAPLLHIFADYFYGAVAQLGRAVLKEALTKALAAIFLKGYRLQVRVLPAPLVLYNSLAMYN